MEMVELTVSMDQIRFDALSFYMGSRENTEPQKALEKMLSEGGYKKENGKWRK